MPKILYSLRTAKNFYVTVPFVYNFRSFLTNSLRFIEVYFFTFHSPGLVIFRRKRKPKIFGFKNAMKRGIRKIVTFVKR